MTEKFKPSKCENINDIHILIDKKVTFFDDIIQKTIIHVQKNKILDILGIGEVNTCIERLGELSKKIREIHDDKSSTDVTINKLQMINNELSCLLKVYGTESLDDLLLICFGNNNNKIVSDEVETGKLELLKKYFHPTSYKVATKKDDSKQKGNDEDLNEAPNLECCDITASYKQFHMKVYGIKVFVRNVALKKGLYIFGIVDDVLIEFLNNKYIINIYKNIGSTLQDNGFHKESFEKFMSSFLLKDYLIYDNEHSIYSRYAGFMSQNTTLVKKQVSQLVREFVTDDLYNKRNTLINLLIYSTNYENQYLAYLLYDILSNDTNGNVDTQEQVILFDSLPWAIKQHFKHGINLHWSHLTICNPYLIKILQKE